MTGTPDEKPSGNSFRTSSERVSEGNWEWFRAEGFRPLWTGPEEEMTYERWREAAQQFGSDNVHEGDVYHSESDRPLRHMPGATLYVRDIPPADQSGESPKTRG
jgi:hypothetical protein